jgi:hypothetical protein
MIVTPERLNSREPLQFSHNFEGFLMQPNRDGVPNMLILVPEAGIEPAWAFLARGILSPLRLPIPPLRRGSGF